MIAPKINNYNFNDLSYPSLCIPRVFSNIKKEKVFYVFKKLNIGYIDHIDMISKTTTQGEKYQRVFIHFSRWFPHARTMRNKIINGEEIKVIYNEPWFWKVFKNNSSNYNPVNPVNHVTPRNPDNYWHRDIHSPIEYRPPSPDYPPPDNYENCYINAISDITDSD